MRGSRLSLSSALEALREVQWTEGMQKMAMEFLDEHLTAGEVKRAIANETSHYRDMVAAGRQPDGTYRIRPNLES